MLLILITLCCSALIPLVAIYGIIRNLRQTRNLAQNLAKISGELELYQRQQLNFHQQYQSQTEQLQFNSLRGIQESLQNSMHILQEQLASTLERQMNYFTNKTNYVSQTLDEKLAQLSHQVEQRLTHGFEHTTNVFSDVVKRLALIDEAQKQIANLSSQVVSLQEIFSDKSARGALGEVQLEALVRNLLPATSYEFQYTLSNGKRADCIIFLPAPTGNIIVDAKFPLESYQGLYQQNLGESEQRNLLRQFKLAIKKHIEDIASKYIIADETSDGAIMFLPAESIFAEIHANHPDLVAEAYRKKVWIVSPTTLMAVLNTARVVLKDAATRKQVHIIQQHLVSLSQDFTLFNRRMDNLAKHLQMANKDVEEVHISARKISQRFEKIENVSWDEQGQAAAQTDEKISQDVSADQIAD